MKTIRIIAWTSSAIAALAILVGIISIISGKSFFGLVHVINYFHVANSFLLLAIALFIATKKCNCDSDCNCKEESK
jgi:hypothetical protein